MPKHRWWEELSDKEIADLEDAFPPPKPKPEKDVPADAIERFLQRRVPPPSPQQTAAQQINQAFEPAPTPPLPDVLERFLQRQPPPGAVPRPQFLGPGAALAARFQGIVPSSIIPQKPIFTQEAFDRAFRANLDERFSRPFGPDADPDRFTIEKAATGLIGAIPGGFTGALAASFAARDQGGNLLDQFAAIPGGAIEGAQQLSRTAVEEDLLGLQGIPPTDLELELPPVTTPWWQDMPGGIGMFAGMDVWMRQGNLLPDVTPQIQLALGWADTDMLELGYIFDEATNKWILPDSEDLGEAQAGLAGAGFGARARRPGGGGGGFGGFARGGGFPSSPRAVQGVGLTNWRI